MSNDHDKPFHYMVTCESDSQHMVRVCRWGIWLKSEIMNSELKDWINCGNTTSVTSFLPSSNYGCFATLAFPKVEVQLMVVKSSYAPLACNLSQFKVLILVVCA